MLFITPQTGSLQAKAYFTQHMDRADYYLRDAPEFSGQWHGLGAELLGLEGTVDRERYFYLCDNINPATGAPLTPHTKANRRILYDFTFDAPKSVSLAYELGGDDRVLDAFRTAVKDTMSEMEGAMMARVRSDKRQEDRTTSNMVWAEFIHRTTRPVDGVPDPQLHCHAVAFNCTFDPVEDKFKAAEFSNLVRDKGYYQAAFHNRLAANLQALGYGTERDGNSFRLRGIDASLTEKFSRRSEVIEAEAERLGITNAKTKGELGRRTRESKAPDGLSVTQLRERWRERLSESEALALEEARGKKRDDGPGTSASMDYALAHCFERGSAVPEKELLKTALIHGVGSVDVAELKRELLRVNILRRERGGVVYATTREVLGEEIALRDFVRDGRGMRAKLGGPAPARIDEGLSPEQREAAGVILGSRDAVTVLKGGAGTGKTRMMQATVKAIENSGKKVFTFAPSAEASRGVLRSEGFANAETVERLLIDPKMQESVNGQVLWVDEAGLLSVKDMKRLFDVAGQQNARLVLSGDTSQHNGVARGDALRLLEKDTGLKTATLKEIRRQTSMQYREAVKALSEGDAPSKSGGTRLEDGIRMLNALGAIRQSAGEERHHAMAADYAEVTRARKADGTLKTALIISPTHREAKSVTDAVRTRLKADGRLGKTERSFTSLRPLNRTEAERGDRRSYLGGEVVQFVQNARGYRRGERAKVMESDDMGVHILRVDGSRDLLPLHEAKRFQLYAEDELKLAAADKLRISMNGFIEREARGGLPGSRAKHRLDNGAVYEVDGFTRGGDIRLSNGYVLPKTYGGITHGYAVTSHASQGKTVDISLVALGHESLMAANKEQFYVSVSRGREAVRLYTDDTAAMIDAARRSSARLLATEIMETEAAKPKRGYLRSLIRAGFVHRAYSALRERMANYPRSVQPISQRRDLRLEH